MKLSAKVFAFVHSRLLRLSFKIFSLVTTVYFGDGKHQDMSRTRYISFGNTCISFSRSSHPTIPELCTTFSLSDFNVEQQSVYVEVILPNHVPLQQPFQIQYRIHNRSNIVHEYKVNLEQINLLIAVAGSTVVGKHISISTHRL
jgi:hypothetical protein